MVLRSRRDYLEAVRLRYRRSCKKNKTVILDEFCAICGYNRKYAIRLLRKRTTTAPSRKRPGPRSVYDDESLLKALKRIWFATDQINSLLTKLDGYCSIAFLQPCHIADISI